MWLEKGQSGPNSSDGHCDDEEALGETPAEEEKERQRADAGDY